MRFQIVKDKLSWDSFDLIHSKNGAVVTFEGKVRDHNEGFQVKCLEYQSYPEMANKVGLKIMEEAEIKFKTEHLQCWHRVGLLSIGETAVLVKAASAHRKEAFLACQYIIDEVKARVPIWKKEYYVNADPQWVACHRCLEMH